LTNDQLKYLTTSRKPDRIAWFSALSEDSSMVLAAKQLAVLPSNPQATQAPRLLDRVREAIRARHDSLRTEEAYVGWIRRFMLFHNQRHPAGMGELEFNQFLTHLAVREDVAAIRLHRAV
jgi:hypothetical protein